MPLPEIDYCEYSSKATVRAAYPTNATSTNFGNTTKGANNGGPMGVSYIRMVKVTSGVAGTLDSVSLYVQYISACNIRCAIYDGSFNLLTNGETEEKAVPAGYDGFLTFNFATSPIVAASTTYYLAWQVSTNNSTNSYYDSGGGAGSFSYKVYTYGAFPSSYTEDGNSTDVWSFYATPTPSLQSYSESTIKTQGSYSLKGVAQATDSLNKTLTKTFSPALDLSGQNQVVFDLRASRTGANLKFGLHNAEVIDQQNTDSNDFSQIGTNLAGAIMSAEQSFQVSGNILVSSVGMEHSAVENTPSGNWIFRIETDNGGEPSGTLVSAGATVTVAPSAVNVETKGTFASPVALSASTTYWLVLKCDLQTNGNLWRIKLHVGGSVYANGQAGRYTDSVWETYSDWDWWFKIYISNEVTTELTPTISSADTFETKTFDLSGVADSNKNNIDSLIITVVNADA